MEADGRKVGEYLAWYVGDGTAILLRRDDDVVVWARLDDADEAMDFYRAFRL